MIIICAVILKVHVLNNI